MLINVSKVLSYISQHMTPPVLTMTESVVQRVGTFSHSFFHPIIGFFDSISHSIKHFKEYTLVQKKSSNLFFSILAAVVNKKDGDLTPLSPFWKKATVPTGTHTPPPSLPDDSRLSPHSSEESDDPLDGQTLNDDDSLDGEQTLSDDDSLDGEQTLSDDDPLDGEQTLSGDDPLDGEQTLSGDVDDTSILDPETLQRALAEYDDLVGAFFTPPSNGPKQKMGISTPILHPHPFPIKIKPTIFEILSTTIAASGYDPQRAFKVIIDQGRFNPITIETMLASDKRGVPHLFLRNLELPWTGSVKLGSEDTSLHIHFNAYCHSPTAPTINPEMLISTFKKQKNQLAHYILCVIYYFYINKKETQTSLQLESPENNKSENYDPKNGKDNFTLLGVSLKRIIAATAAVAIGVLIARKRASTSTK